MKALPTGLRTLLVPLVSRAKWRFVSARHQVSLPLSGRWLRYFLTGMAVLAGGVYPSWPGRLKLRVYLASGLGRPYAWHPPPRQGLDCQGRMIVTLQGEVARSLRMGDLVVEVAQFEGIANPSPLRGPDCR